MKCLYDPFTFRSGMSWIAHWLPFEEGLALGVTNTVFLLVAIGLVLLTLKAQGFSPRVILAAGALFAIGWNPFFFGTAVLVDSGVLAAIALCWYLLVIKRPWFVWPILLLGYPLKETVGIVVPVILVWAWVEYRAGRRSLVSAAAPAIAATIAFVVGVAFWRQALPTAAAAWPVTPDVGNIIHNAGDIIGLASFVVGAGPLLIISALRYWRVKGRQGWIQAAIDPAVVGVVVALGICGWSFITVDLTPRIFWIGFPFATSLAAYWFTEGRPAEWLDKLRLPRSLTT